MFALGATGIGGEAHGSHGSSYKGWAQWPWQARLRRRAAVSVTLMKTCENTWFMIFHDIHVIYVMLHIRMIYDDIIISSYPSILDILWISIDTLYGIHAYPTSEVSGNSGTMGLYGQLLGLWHLDRYWLTRCRRCHIWDVTHMDGETSPDPGLEWPKMS